MLKFSGRGGRSPDHFSVTFGRDWLVYEKGGRKMTISADAGCDQIVIFTETLGRWDDDFEHRLDEPLRDKILHDIAQNLTERGLEVKILPIG
jgi:hypothetical protein